MHLSSDRKTLIRVTQEDIVDGTCIIPEGVSIGDDVFCRCTRLRRITIPTGASIGRSAFSGCTGLRELIIHEGVNMGEYAFASCTGLTTVTLSERVNIGLSAFSGCTRLSELIIHERVNMGDYAFASCTDLTTVTIPEGVNIGRSAFANCTGMAAVTIPRGANIGQDAFHRCTSLAHIVITSEDIKEIENIKIQLPEGLQNKVCLNPCCKKITNAQHIAYQAIISDPMVNPLYCFRSSIAILPVDILPTISDLQGDAYIAFKKAIARFALPYNDEQFVRYQALLHGAQESLKITLGKKHQISPVCVAKLEAYVSRLNTLMTRKNENHPGFFESNLELRDNLINQLAVVNKLIAYSKGNKHTCFTEQDKLTMQEGFIGQILRKFDVDIRTLAMEKRLDVKQENSMAEWKFAMPPACIEQASLSGRYGWNLTCADAAHAILGVLCIAVMILLFPHPAANRVMLESGVWKNKLGGVSC